MSLTWTGVDASADSERAWLSAKSSKLLGQLIWIDFELEQRHFLECSQMAYWWNLWPQGTSAGLATAKANHVETTGGTIGLLWILLKE
jgi:hypothetical protein